MSTRLFHDAQQWELDDGLPNNGGKITFWEPGTTTLKSVYTTVDLDVAHTNPVILDANGRPTNPIWLSGEYKYAVTTSGDVAVGLTIDNLNADTAAAVTESGLLVANGSLEIDTGDDGTPDSWTLSALTSATIAVDTTDSAHGVNSLLFTSGGNGGGAATCTRFDVEKSKPIIVAFTYKASAVDVLTKVDVKTYDKDNVIVSTLSAYSEAAANPTSYTEYVVAVDADATAVTAEIVVTGIDAASTTKTAGTTTNVDNIRAYTKQGGIALETIYDDNGNESLEFVTTASAVNNPRFTNAATGNAATLDVTETNSDLDFPRNGTGDITVDSTPIYGLVILDTPVQLAQDTSLSSTAKAEIDITAQTTGVAVKAMIRVESQSVSTTTATMTCRVGEADETFSAVHDATFLAMGANGFDAQCFNTVTVNLKVGEIFAWELIETGAISTSHTTTLYLVGYYV